MPFQIIHESSRLRIVFFDTITPPDLRTFTDTILAIERSLVVTPNRVSDLTGVIDWSVGYAEMLTLAERRREQPPANPVRSAIVAADPASLGFARMFQILNDHPLVAVEIFSTIAEAEAWLAAD